MVEGSLDVGGAVAFWSLAESSDRDRLAAGFAALGLGSFVPEPRAAPAVLRDALEEVLGGPRVLVRPLATHPGPARAQVESRAERPAAAWRPPLLCHGLHHG